DPRTPLEAKFSMQFAMASAIVARTVGIPQLTTEFINDSVVRSLFDKVDCELTTETMEGSAFAPSEAVEIHTRSGHVFKSGDVVHPKGSYQRPLSRNELWEKFSACLGADFAERDRERCFEELARLEFAKNA